MSIKPKISTVLFDLDGTLVDTALDLGRALNIQLARHQKPTLTDAQIRPFASHGSRGLLGLGFGITPQDANFEQMKAEYLDIYDSVLLQTPKLMAGMAELLQAIEKQGFSWGIVTNKPRRFTVPLVQKMGLNADCVVSGDDAPQPKPEPATLLLACAQLDVQPENCIYLGDAERDIQAAHAAGMRAVVALFGYLDVIDKPESWGADAMIAQPIDLLKLLN